MKRVLMFDVPNGQVPIVAGSLWACEVREWRGGKFVDEMIIKGTDLMGRLCVLKRCKGEHSVTLRDLQNLVAYYNAIHLPNVRFWDYCSGGYVRIVLRPGEVLTWHRGAPTDEGHISQSVRYEYSTEFHDLKQQTRFILREEFVAESDCDGKHEWSSLRAFSPDFWETRPAVDFDRELGFDVPIWLPLNSSQRDHTAEAAGY